MSKQQIIATAITLFEKKGYAETSVQDIVNALGATKGTFYYYFTSKNELLKRIHLEFIEELLIKQKKS